MLFSLRFFNMNLLVMICLALGLANPLRAMTPDKRYAIIKATYKIRLMTMEQRASKIVNNCLNTNIYSYLETSGGQTSNPYLNVVNFLNTRAD